MHSMSKQDRDVEAKQCTGPQLSTPSKKIIVSKECCMCGDVGFEHELFRCSSCRRRYQHRYCSSCYPNAIPSEERELQCDWCLPHKSKSPRLQPPTPTKVKTAHQSALDCLLEIAESTLNSERQKSEQLAGCSSSKGGMERMTSLKKYREGYVDKVKHMPVERLRKNCSDKEMAMATNPSPPPPPAIKIKKDSPSSATIRRPSAAPAAPVVAAAPRQQQHQHQQQQQQHHGRRYRLLSEVLC